MGELAEGSAAPHYWGTSSTGGVAPEPAAMYRDYLARKKDEFGKSGKKHDIIRTVIFCPDFRVNLFSPQRD